MLAVFAVVGNRPALLDVNVGRRPPGFHVDYCAVCFHGGRPWIMDGCVKTTNARTLYPMGVTPKSLQIFLHGSCLFRCDGEWRNIF